MAFIAKIDRRRLLDVLGDAAESTLHIEREVTKTSQLLGFIDRAGGIGPSELLLMWQDKHSIVDESTSFVIVVQDAAYDDFLAWSTTYLGTHIPFTAFFRVLRVSDIDRYDLLDEREGSLSHRLLAQLCGVVIAEAAIQTDFKARRPTSITLQSCQLTFSFAALKALRNGLHPVQLFDLAEAWSSARKQSSGRPLVLDSDRSLSFWLIATSALLDDPPPSIGEIRWTSIVTDLVRAARNGQVGLATRKPWQGFEPAYDALVQFEDVSSQTRERQLRRLDEIASNLRSSNLPVPFVEAILGLLIARLGNGSFEYLGLAGEFKSDFTGCALWFALFSIWQTGFDGLTAGNCLGRHIDFDVGTRLNIFSRPTADVSLQEFVLLGSRKSSGILNNTTTALLEVELLPCVTGRFPNPFKRPEDDIVRAPRAAETQRVGRLLREALYLLDKAEVDPSWADRTDTQLPFPEDPAGMGVKPRYPKRRKK